MKRLITIFIAAALLVACAKPEQKAEDVRPVRVQTVVLGKSDAVAGYAGEVRARYETRVAFRVPGKIVSRHVDVGAVVRPGQLLARLDPKDLILAEENAKAQSASAQSERDLAASELSRYRDLHAKKFISQAELDRRESTLKTADARLEALRAQHRQSSNQASYAAIHADTAGVVLAIEAEAGQVVAAGQTVARIARLEEKEIEINVSEQSVGQMRGAGPVAVRAWALPDKIYRGKVREIAPAADPVTRTYSVRVSVLDADESLRWGMTANVALAGGRAAPAESAALIPLTALTQKGDVPAVWVLDAGNKLRLKPVEVGQYRENGVVITKGLADGERVVTAGVHKLREGQAVRPLAEAAPSGAAPVPAALSAAALAPSK